MSAMDIFADLMRPRAGKIAQHSPSNRPQQKQSSQVFSPFSPLSPLIGKGKVTAPVIDIFALAAGIAAEFRLPAAAVLELLDDEDKQAISTGSDPERPEAWRAAVASLVRQGGCTTLPGKCSCGMVTCCGCRHTCSGLMDGLQ